MSETLSVKTDGGVFELYSPTSTTARIRLLQGREWNTKKRCWTVPSTSTAAANVKNICRALGIDLAPDDEFRRLAALYEERVCNLARSPEAFAPPPNVDTVPMAHQNKGYALTKSDGFFLLWEMGTGKTKTGIDALVNCDDRLVLVACPKRVIKNWAKEFSKHAQSHAGRFILLQLHKHSVKKRAEAVREALDRLTPSQTLVVIVNYDSIWMAPLGELILSVKWDTVIADEIHRIKDHKGRASQFFDKLRRVSRRRIGLTGTIMPRDPLDIFGQARFIDPAVFGTNYYGFEKKYAIKGGFECRQVVGFREQADMNRRLYTIAYRVTKEEVLELPEFQHVQIDVELGVEARKVYDSLRDLMRAGLKDGTITATNSLTRLIRFQQITSGYAVKDSEVEGLRGEEVRVDTAKQDALNDLMLDLPAEEPIVIFYQFNGERESIYEASRACGRKVKELSGHKDELEEWQRGGGTVLAVQIAAGGTGVDMVRARYCVFFSCGYSTGAYDQALSRLHRKGQTHQVTYFHLIATDTVDEDVYAAMRTKTKVIQHVLMRIGDGIDMSHFNFKLTNEE